jgi:hypothetical protein
MWLSHKASVTGSEDDNVKLREASSVAQTYCTLVSTKPSNCKERLEPSHYSVEGQQWLKLTV